MGHQAGWVSSRRGHSVIFRRRCSSISSFWVRSTCTLQDVLPAITVLSPEDLTVTLRSLCFSVAVSCVEASRPLPDFVDIDLQDRTLPDGILLEHLKAFQTLYREHCEVGGYGQRHNTHTDYNTLD